MCRCCVLMVCQIRRGGSMLGTEVDGGGSEGQNGCEGFRSVLRSDVAAKWGIKK